MRKCFWFITPTVDGRWGHKRHLKLKVLGSREIRRDKKFQLPQNAEIIANVFSYEQLFRFDVAKVDSDTKDAIGMLSW